MPSHYDQPGAFDPVNVRKPKKITLRDTPIGDPYSDLGVLSGFGNLKPSARGYTAPTTTPGYGQLGLDPAMGSFGRTLLQPQPLSEDPALSRFSSTLLQRPPTTPVPSQGMRDVFEAKERSMNLPGSIPQSLLDMAGEKPPEPEIMAAGLPSDALGAIWGGLKTGGGWLKDVLTSDSAVPADVPAKGSDAWLGITAETLPILRQDPTRLGEALLSSTGGPVDPNISPRMVGQAYLDQNYPITPTVTPTVTPAVTPTVTPTVTGPVIGGSPDIPGAIKGGLDVIGRGVQDIPGAIKGGLDVIGRGVQDIFGVDQPLTDDVRTVTGPVIGGSPESRKAAGDPGFQFADRIALGPYGPYGAGPPAVIEPPPSGIPTSPNDLADEEFSGAWYWLQTQGTLSPGSIRTTRLDTGDVDAQGNPIFAEMLTPRSRALLDEHNRKRAEIETTRAFEEGQTQFGQQFGLAGRAQTEVERAAEAREALERMQLGLVEPVRNLITGEWEMAPPPSTLAERELGQRRTEATEAESFRRAQLAEQVAAREAQATQVQLAREQESELARLAMGVAGPGYMDPDRGWVSGIPSTLGQRQLEEQVAARGQQFGEQVTARQQEQQLARLAMGLGPTGPMDPTQTLAARRFEEERQLERVRMGLDPTATMDPTQTLAARQFAAQMGIGDEGQKAIPYQQLQLQRALAGLAGEGGVIPQTLAERQFVEQQRLANIQAGITEGQPTTAALPFRQFEEQEKQAREAEAIRRIQLGIPLGDLAGGLPGDFKTRAELEAGLERTSREQQASLQRTMEDTIARMTRDLGEREQNIQRRLAEISLGLDTEGEQALPYRQFTEQVRATQRGEALQQAALQGRIGGDETVAGRAQTEAERAAGIREALERAQLLGTLDGTETLEAQLARAALEGRIVGGELGETVAGRVQTEAERAAEVREALQRAQVFGAEDGEFTLEAQLARAGLTGMLDQQPTLERARLFGGAGGVPTLEAELARAGLTGMLGEDPTLARRQLAQQGETASLNALVNVFQSAMQNPYAFSAMRTMAGGGAPFANLLAPLGFAMPGQVGQGAGQFFPGGTPTMGQFAEADPEGLNYLQALLGFSGVSPAQLAQLSAGITPGVRALLPPGMGTFRGRGLR